MTKRIFLALAVALAVLGSFLPRRAAADEVSFSFFYDNLSPYGAWIDVEGYGTCWQPDAIPVDWAPYTDGSWVYTDAGWTWVSNEDFGEIVYHYGRWVRLEGLGWVWRPDTEWGPAWVSWRSSDDYIGWAPLPPEIPFTTGIGISGWIDDSLLGPLSYSFCLVEDFGAPRLRSVLFARERNFSIIHHTTNITHITVNRFTRIVHNGGPDYRSISKRSRRHIERLRLDRRTSASDYRRGGRAVRSHGALIVHAPRVKNDHRHAPKTRKNWNNASIDRGWKGVNKAERQRWEEKVRNEQRQHSREPARPAPHAFGYNSGRQGATPHRNVDRDEKRSGGKNAAVKPPTRSPSPWSDSRAPHASSPNRGRSVEQGNDRAKQAEQARKKQEKAFKKQVSSRKVEKRQEPREAPRRQETRPDRQRSKARSSSQSRDRAKKPEKKKERRNEKHDKRNKRDKRDKGGKRDKGDKKDDKKRDKKKR